MFYDLSINFCICSLERNVNQGLGDEGTIDLSLLDGDETDRTQTTSNSSVFGLNISVVALEESRKQTILNLVDTERIESMESKDEDDILFTTLSSVQEGGDKSNDDDDDSDGGSASSGSGTGTGTGYTHSDASETMDSRYSSNLSLSVKVGQHELYNRQKVFLSS